MSLTNYLLSLLLIVFFSFGHAFASGDRQNEELDIRKTTEAFFEAWNANDIEGLVSHWSDDAVLINPRGQKVHGKRELKSLFAREHKEAGNTVEKLVSISIRFLANNLAWVDVDLTVDNAHGTDGQTLPQIKFHLSGVIRKESGKWLWLEGRPYQFFEK